MHQRCPSFRPGPDIHHDRGNILSAKASNAQLEHYECRAQQARNHHKHQRQCDLRTNEAISQPFAFSPQGRFPDWHIIAFGAVRLSIHAGAMPQSSAQKTAQLAVTVSTVASGRIESAIGNLSPLADKRRSRMRHPIHPNASPNKPPGTATARLRAEHQEHRRYCHSQYFLAQPAILNEFSVRKNRAIRVSRIGRYLETWLGNLA